MKQTTTPKVSLTFSLEAGLGLPITRGTGYSRKGNRFIPYEATSLRIKNCRNNLPQMLAKFALESPTHGAAIQRKSFMIEGQGVDLSLLSPEAMDKLENSLNRRGETLNDIHEKVSKDYALYGGYALKVIWGTNGKISQVEHLPFEQVRKGEPDENGDITHYIISNNWNEDMASKYEFTYSLPAFNPSFFDEGVRFTPTGIPKPTEEQLQQAVQLIYKYDYTPSASSGMDFYPLPEYWAGIDSVLTEREIIIANKSLIDNGFSGKYIITLPFIPNTEDEKAELDKLLRINNAGAQNHGELLTLYAPDKDSMPVLSKLEPIEADTYLNVDVATKQSIITAHQIPAILLEYSQGGGFNNRAEEMTVAFEQYQATKIKQLQTKLERTYKTLLYYMGYDNEQVDILPFTLSKSDSSTAPSQGETTLNS